MIPAHADPEAAARSRAHFEHRTCLFLLDLLVYLTDGLPVNQHEHALQCAALAAQAGAREEMVLVALLHDIGKPLGTDNHPAIAAEILKGRLSEDAYWVLRTHGEFQECLNRGWQMEMLERRYGGRNWWRDALALARWDAESFEPGRDVPGLEGYRPMLARLYGLD